MLWLMRSVFVFSPLEQSEMIDVLDELLPQQRNPWTVGGDLYINVVDQHDGLLFSDWEDEHAAAVQIATGHRPRWAVQVDVSGRIDGTSEVRWLAMKLLEYGGVATDDYSEHCWTHAQIENGATVDDLHFFDSEGYRRHSERRQQ